MSAVDLDQAVATASTGDIWLFRGSAFADRTIRAATNSPVNHVGMSVVLARRTQPLAYAASSARSHTVGMVVDSVSDVCELGGDAIKPTPMMNSHVDMSFTTGIANVGERMLILMDIEALMSASDMGLIESAT